MHTWKKRLEFAINIAILCAFLMVASLAARRLFDPRSQAAVRPPAMGATVSLLGADWRKSEASMVLALSTGCHFCSESAEFYKRLVPYATSHGVQVFAALPQTPDESRAYLEHLGVADLTVTQAPLDSLDVSATPTILLVDRQGKIRKAWVGKLDSDGQREVLESVADGLSH